MWPSDARSPRATAGAGPGSRPGRSGRVWGRGWRQLEDAAPAIPQRPVRPEVDLPALDVLQGGAVRLDLAVIEDQHLAAGQGAVELPGKNPLAVVLVVIEKLPGQSRLRLSFPPGDSSPNSNPGSSPCRESLAAGPRNRGSGRRTGNAPGGDFERPHVDRVHPAPQRPHVQPVPDQDGQRLDLLSGGDA